MSYRYRAGIITRASALLITAIAVACAGLDTALLKQDAASIQPWLVETRRALHSKPELMYEEHETSEYIRGALDNMGIKYR